MSIPSLTGYTSTYANVGKTSGWGIDLQVNAVPVETKDFTWNSTVTWSMDRNKIDELSNGRTEDVNNNWFVGEEIGVYYDYVYDGIWKTSEAEEAAVYGRKPGQIKVKDLNNDDKIEKYLLSFKDIIEFESRVSLSSIPTLPSPVILILPLV